MNVNDTYVLMQYIISKNTQQGYLSPVDFNTVINQAQRSYISYLLGSIQKYQYGRPIAPVELGGSMTLRQILTPFIKETNLLVSNTGTCPYPTDFVQVDAMWTITGLNRIRQVEQDKLYSFYNSQIDPVADWPIYLIKVGGFQFYPETIGSAKLSYIMEPPKIIWSYTLDGNGRPVYSEAGPQLATTATGAGWAGSNFAGGYTHTPGNTAPLVNTAIVPLLGFFYDIEVTVTAATVGTLQISFGGLSSQVDIFGETSLTGFASTLDSLVLTPSSAFDGTVVVSIRQPSRQPLWEGTAMLDVIGRALMMTGVNLQSSAILSYATELKNQGQ